LGDQLKAISDEAEDIVWLGGAGGYRLNNVANEVDAMKQTVVNLQKSWDQYESDNRAVFNTVQDLISQTFSLLKQTLTIPRGYSYSVGSFRNLMSQNFLSAYQASSDYVTNAQNQKEFSKDWETISKDYNQDQTRLAEEARKKAEEEANKNKGFWDIVIGVGALVLGAAAIIATAGMATPLVAMGITAGVASGLYGASLATEGGQMVVTGADKGFNFVRDTVFGGNQTLYNNFGNVAMVAAGTMTGVGLLSQFGVTGAIANGLSRVSLPTLVPNFVMSNGGAMALAGVGVGSVALPEAVADTGAIVIAGGIASGVSSGIMQFSRKNFDDSERGGTERMGPRRGNTPRNNQAQNKQVEDIGKKLGLNNDELRTLHDEISHQGYGYQEILELAKELFGK
ncbi:MAG: hypothetical protein LBI13_00460, partial [Streptococcaceae bacterium]|nr:hypothetical protein [Streptococcaceae bacterium]